MPDDPPTTRIDTAVFAELQDAAGAEFVGELVGTFFDEAPQMLAEMHAALQLRDADRYRRAAHSLKSNGHTFGASALAALARAQELGGLPADAAPLAALEAEYTLTAAALKELCHG
jgi:histidine phosphotransfer protein HptB